MRVRKLARRVGQVIAVAAVGVVLSVGSAPHSTADDDLTGTDDPDTPIWEAEQPDEQPPDDDPGVTFTPIWE